MAEGISSQIIKEQHEKRKRNVTGLCCNRQGILGLEEVLVYRQENWLWCWENVASCKVITQNHVITRVWTAILNLKLCSAYNFYHNISWPIRGVLSGFWTNNMDSCTSSVFFVCNKWWSFSRWICCHGFLFPLLFSPVYFPFYCPLLLAGININEFHNVVCTPLLTLVRVATPYWAIISKAGNSPPQTISFTFLDGSSVLQKRKKKKTLFIRQCRSLSTHFKIPSGAITHLQLTRWNKCLRVTKSIHSTVTW